MLKCSSKLFLVSILSFATLNLSGCSKKNDPQPTSEVPAAQSNAPSPTSTPAESDEIVGDPLNPESELGAESMPGTDSTYKAPNGDVYYQHAVFVSCNLSKSKRDESRYYYSKSDNFNGYPSGSAYETFSRKLKNGETCTQVKAVSKERRFEISTRTIQALANPPSKPPYSFISRESTYYDACNYSFSVDYEQKEDILRIRLGQTHILNLPEGHEPGSLLAIKLIEFNPSHTYTSSEWSVKEEQICTQIAERYSTKVLGKKLKPYKLGTPCESIADADQKLILGIDQGKMECVNQAIQQKAHLDFYYTVAFWEREKFKQFNNSNSYYNEGDQREETSISLSALELSMIRGNAEIIRSVLQATSDSAVTSALERFAELKQNDSIKTVLGLHNPNASQAARLINIALQTNNLELLKFLQSSGVNMNQAYLVNRDSFADRLTYYLPDECNLGFCEYWRDRSDLHPFMATPLCYAAAVSTPEIVSYLANLPGADAIGRQDLEKFINDRDKSLVEKYSSLPVLPPVKCALKRTQLIGRNQDQSPSLQLSEFLAVLTTLQGKGASTHIPDLEIRTSYTTKIEKEDFLLSFARSFGGSEAEQKFSDFMSSDPGLVSDFKPLFKAAIHLGWAKATKDILEHAGSDEIHAHSSDYNSGFHEAVDYCDSISQNS